MTMTPEIRLAARTPEIGDLVEACARGTISFGDLIERVDKMGFKTTSLYEMVRAAEATAENTKLREVK